MAKDYVRLWKDVASTTDEGKAVRKLAEVLVDKEGRTFMSSLECKDAELCIEILDNVGRNSHLPPLRHLRLFHQGIAEHKLKTVEKQAFFVTLRRLAGIHGRLPDSMMITGKIEVEDEIAASGGFADVRIGRYMGRLVAVKNMRLSEQDDTLMIRKVNVSDHFLAALTILQQFCKEVILWNTLSHPNVLKLAGVQGNMEKGQFITVSEWMAHGNIMQYIKNNSVNRLELVRGFAFPATPSTEMR